MFGSTVSCTVRLASIIANSSSLGIFTSPASHSKLGVSLLENVIWQDKVTLSPGRRSLVSPVHSRGPWIEFVWHCRKVSHWLKLAQKVYIFLILKTVHSSDRKLLSNESWKSSSVILLQYLYNWAKSVKSNIKIQILHQNTQYLDIIYKYILFTWFSHYM